MLKVPTAGVTVTVLKSPNGRHVWSQELLLFTSRPIKFIKFLVIFF